MGDKNTDLVFCGSDDFKMDFCQALVDQSMQTKVTGIDSELLQQIMNKEYEFNINFITGELIRFSGKVTGAAQVKDEVDSYILTFTDVFLIGKTAI